jgi:hypothetical protein
VDYFTKRTIFLPVFPCTSTIPKIPNSHTSDEPLDFQTIILKPLEKARPFLTPPKLCEQNSQHENTQEV